MPSGFGGGKSPLQDLPEDPIESEPEQKTVAINQLFTARHRRQRVTPSSIPQYAPYNSEQIAIPYSEMSLHRAYNTRGHHNSLLSGIHRPTNSLHAQQSVMKFRHNVSSMNSRKRNREDRETFVIQDAIAPPSIITDDEELQQRAELCRGRKRAKVEALKAKGENAPKDVDPTPSSIKQNRSQNFPIELPSGHGDAERRSSRSGESSIWSQQGHEARTRNPKLKPVSKTRTLMSSKSGLSWPLLTFQCGTEQYDSEDLRLEVSGKPTVNKPVDFRVLRGGRDEEFPKVFSRDKIMRSMVCEEERSFGLEFRGMGPHYGYLVLKRHSDMQPLCDLLGPVKVDPERMLNHCNSIEEWKSRYQSKEGELVDDPAEMKRLQDDRDHGLATRLDRDESPRRSSRGKPNIAKPREPLPNTRATRSRKTAPVEAPKLAPSVFLDSKHRVTRSELLPIQELPPVWKQPLLYPFEGAKRANVDFEDLTRLRPTEFLNDNIINFYLRYIEEDLKEKNPDLHQETHFFNTFFYERLSMKGGKLRNMEGVLKWTAKIDLFKKNYIIVPINESSHWYLAIICNLQHLERKLQKDPAATDSEATITADSDAVDEDSSPGPTNDQQPAPNLDKPPDEMDAASEKDRTSETRDSLQNMSVEEVPGEDNEWPEPDENQEIDQKLAARNRNIKIKDSSDEVYTEMIDPISSLKDTQTETKVLRKNPHFQSPDTPAIIILDSMGCRRNHTVTRLRDWLVFEARNKRSLEIPKDALKGTHPKAPNQDNWHDCGLYMLHYIEIFLEQREQLVASFLARDNALEPKIWRDSDIKGMRTRLFILICDLQKAYDAKYPVKTPSAVKAKQEVSPTAKAKTPSRAVDYDEMPSRKARNESPGTQIIREAACVAEPTTAEDKMDLDNHLEEVSQSIDERKEATDNSEPEGEYHSGRKEKHEKQPRIKGARADGEGQHMGFKRYWSPASSQSRSNSRSARPTYSPEL